MILVHGPDIVREAICSFEKNWFFRMDVYFAFHIRMLQYWSDSWRQIKANINTNWFDGWSFIQQVTEVSLKKEWNKCEDEMFNLRNFCDESIESVPVLRIIAKNDFVVPFKSIDEKYFKHLNVLISERGGHCGVSRCNITLDAIKKWNDNIVNNIDNNVNHQNDQCKKVNVAG